MKEQKALPPMPPSRSPSRAVMIVMPDGKRLRALRKVSDSIMAILLPRGSRGVAGVDGHRRTGDVFRPCAEQELHGARHVVGVRQAAQRASADDLVALLF